MDYFPHDSHAMSDDKLLALRINGGLEAVAIYWCVVEKMYADEKPFEVSETNVEATSVLYRLGVGFQEFEKYVSMMLAIGLFERDEENPNLIISKRVKKQIEELDKKRVIARQNGKAGGRKPKGKNSRNQRETDVGSNGKPTSAPNKTLNSIGFDKQNQILCEERVAAVAEATPRSSKPACPLCGTDLEKTGISGTEWWCNCCREGYADGKVRA